MSKKKLILSIIISLFLISSAVVLSFRFEAKEADADYLLQYYSLGGFWYCNPSDPSSPWDGNGRPCGYMYADDEYADQYSTWYSQYCCDTYVDEYCCGGQCCPRAGNCPNPPYYVENPEICDCAVSFSFMDDWGSQNSLLVSPELWRDFFKPLYKDYCDLIHSKNKYAVFHSDGYIEPIFPDLIEIGIDAINSQLFCMNIEEIGKKYRGKITFWGEIDRQRILPFGTRDEVANAVKRVKEALWIPEGGIIAQCEFGIKDPIENIKAVFEEGMVGK